MKLIFVAFVMINAVSLFGQSSLIKSKPAIDSAAIRNWTGICDDVAPVFSNDGKYLAYHVGQCGMGLTYNDPAYFKNRCLVVQSLKGEWEKKFSRGDQEFFSEDSKKLVYLKDDTLNILILGTSDRKILTGVQSFKTLSLHKEEWIACTAIGMNQELRLYNLITGQNRTIPFVSDYSFDENLQSIIIKTELDSGNIKVPTLQKLNLSTGRLENIWVGNSEDSIESYSLNVAGNNVVFLRSSVTEVDGFTGLD